MSEYYLSNPMQELEIGDLPDVPDGNYAQPIDDCVLVPSGPPLEESTCDASDDNGTEIAARELASRTTTRNALRALALAAGVALIVGRFVDKETISNLIARILRIKETQAQVVEGAWAQVHTASNMLCPDHPIQPIGHMGDTVRMLHVPDKLCNATGAPVVVNTTIDTILADIHRARDTAATMRLNSYHFPLSGRENEWLSFVDLMAHDYEQSIRAMRVTLPVRPTKIGDHPARNTHAPTRTISAVTSVSSTPASTTPTHAPQRVTARTPSAQIQIPTYATDSAFGGAISDSNDGLGSGYGASPAMNVGHHRGALRFVTEQPRPEVITIPARRVPGSFPIRFRNDADRTNYLRSRGRNPDGSPIPGADVE